MRESSGMHFSIIFILFIFPSFSLHADFTTIHLLPGEEGNYTLTITNHLERRIDIKIALEGEVEKFVKVEKEEVRIPPRGSSSISLSVKAPSEGIYHGNLVIVGEGDRKKIPLSIRVTSPARIEIEVEIQKKIEQGEGFLPLISIYNYGSPTDVLISVEVKDAATGELVEKYEELLHLLLKKDVYPQINLSGAGPGVYWMEVKASYNNHTITEIESFEIVGKIIPSFRPEFILATLLVGAGIFIGGIWIRELITEVRKKRLRYLLASKYTNLPKGELWIGKIAETRHKARFSLDDLTTHVLLAGATGSGKTIAAMVFVEEILRRGIPALICDPTAQWTGILRACRDKGMLKAYRKFRMKKEDATSFRGKIVLGVGEIGRYMDAGKVTVFNFPRIDYEKNVRNFIQRILDEFDETSSLRLVIVFEEVHRLLPRYGASPESYLSLERASREFRRLGIALIMTSQLLSDFSEEIRNNVLTEVQLHTKASADIERVRQKYGEIYGKLVPKLEVGIGMVQNPRYNQGKPFFVTFRPTYHDPHKLAEEEMEIYRKLSGRIEELRKVVKGDLLVELDLAQENLEECKWELAKLHLKAVEGKVK